MTESSNNRTIPGPKQLPGIEGFYILTPAGELARYRSDGELALEQGLSESIADKIRLLLKQYRSGDESVAMALVVPRVPEQSWRSASMVFSDRGLREFYRTSTDHDAPLTTFQKRNRFKSVFQGMEVVLDAKEATQPPYPRACPVLFVPEMDASALGQRYNLDSVEPSAALEVLDLMALLTPEDRRHSVLTKMVMEMQRTRIAPEMRSGPELVLAATAGASGKGPAEPDPAKKESPWEDVPEKRDTCFNAGDPVTYWLLAWFAPFNELNDLQRQFIARGHTITKKPAGTLLIERGSLEDLSIYLVEGTIELEAFDGKTMDIVGGTKQAHLPISQLRPHAYTVRAATDVTVILVSQRMVREVTRITTTYKNRPGIEVTEGGVLPDNIPGLEPQSGQS